jgi:outer membrane receptor protein involved in Fe transport
VSIFLRVTASILAAVLVVGPVSVATASAAGKTIVAQANQIAQADQSTLVGHVTDSSGASLSGAGVAVEGGNHTYTTTTTNDGSFTLTLPPGVYSITITRSGYQAAQNDLTLAAGRTVFSVALQESSLSSLREIGHTVSTSKRTPFNVTESSVSILPPLEIALRQNNNLTDTVATMPGVVASRTFSATPNTSFVVRGAAIQTRVTLDGHPVSSGIFGQWNTNYAVSGIFDDVEVVKGTGLNGAIAGESAVGTVNLRTRNFSPNNSAGLQIGSDNYNGGIYNAFADVNFFNNKASLIVAKSFSGYNGPWNNYFGDRAGRISNITPGVGSIPQIMGLDQWQGDFSNRYSLEGELVKGRYRFSEATSVTAEFLGLQGQYTPQGGSYGTYDGLMTLQACQNGSAFQPTLVTCNASSTFTAPYTFGNIGNMVNAYTWFPNSYIQNNEPQFAAEFRTTYKDDTILFRPYAALINRYISGAFENQYPGNGGGWNAVTSVANCQVKYLAPGAVGGPATGAAGPCWPANMTPNSPSYIGSDTTGHVFTTTPNAPVCSAAPPFTCFTSPTGIENDGKFGYSTPFSQPELDRLNGYTFSWTHPAGPNVYNFSYDYRKDYAQSASTDQTPAAPGCTFVIGSVSGVRSNSSPILPGTANVYDNTGQPYQASCSDAQFGQQVTAATPFAALNLLPRSSIGTPPTVSQYGDFALTGTWQLGEHLAVALGNYFEIYRLNSQIEDPAVLAAFAARGNANAAPVALISATQSYSHYDPHVGIVYRPTYDLSLRVNAGSSITPPFAGLVSGFGSISIPNAAAHNYTNTIPNFNLKPESTVAYDFGLDTRFRDGSVFSMDLYNIAVHNVFLSNSTVIPPIAGIPTFPDTLFVITNQVNGPLQQSYGVELQLSKNPTLGWGYYLSTTFSRTYYPQLPSSIYLSNSFNFGNFNVPGAQIFGNPFGKGYAQLLYAGAHGSLFEFGMDWEGQDNSTLGPGYTIFEASMRAPIAPKAFVQLSVQNLFNYSTGTGLGRNLASQGNFEPTAYYNTTTNQILPAAGSATSVQALPPRNIRLSLNFHT